MLASSSVMLDSVSQCSSSIVASVSASCHVVWQEIVQLPDELPILIDVLHLSGRGPIVTWHPTERSKFK